jgi:hypothetical protein
MLLSNIDLAAVNCKKIETEQTHQHFENRRNQGAFLFLTLNEGDT